MLFRSVERQTQTNKETNKNKQSHLIDRSSFNHMRKKNNRTASVRSRARHAQSSIYHLQRKNNRTAQERSRRAVGRSESQSGKNITSLGTPWVNPYQSLQEPMALKTPLRRSRLSHSSITCLGVQVGRADKELRQPIAVKARPSNLVIIYI